MPSSDARGIAGFRLRPLVLAVACLVATGFEPLPDESRPWQKVEEAAQLIGSDFVRPVPRRTLEMAAMRGLWTAGGRSGPMSVPEGEATGDFAAFARLAALLHPSGKPVPSLIDGALRTMVAALDDPYSRYLDAAAYRQFQENRSGSYAGVGIRVVVLDGHPRVGSVLAGSSAAKAGLRAGDWLETINGKGLTALTAERISQQLRGPIGSTVTLRVTRAGRTRPVPLVRRPITIRPVSLTWLPGRIAHLRLTSFASIGAVSTMRRQLQALLAAKPAGLVVDLRHNPGGDVDMVREIGGLFLTDAVMIVALDRSGNRMPLRSRGRPIVPPALPLAVLIDGQSASAAEILAAALRDQRGAKLIGERSFGKGCIQVIQGLRDGTALVLTTLLYFTIDGQPLNGVGLQPDVPVSQGPDPGVPLGVGALSKAIQTALHSQSPARPGSPLPSR